jgi:hypothetical protein
MKSIQNVAITALCLSFLTTIAYSHVPQGQESQQESAPKTQEVTPPQKREEPVVVLRRFLLALVTSDTKQLRQDILPVPDEDFKLLLANRPIPEEAKAEIRAAISEIPIRELKPGEKIRLGTGRTFTVPTSPEGINLDKEGRPIRFCLVEGDPMPQVLVYSQEKNRWLVDTSILIAARKKAREKSQQNQSTAPPVESP